MVAKDNEEEQQERRRREEGKKTQGQRKEKEEKKYRCVNKTKQEINEDHNRDENLEAEK